MLNITRGKKKVKLLKGLKNRDFLYTLYTQKKPLKNGYDAPITVIFLKIIFKLSIFRFFVQFLKKYIFKEIFHSVYI